MIPSTTNRLLVAEDWTKIYQSFRNADFKSYDFETLRRTMISYLRENYPEEFNDYIDSSEFIALIDVIAFLGQNLSFRIDLNARENFLETAERRESILRLARLINYNPKRNSPANGFLKIASVATTESVFDANGINLANSIIGWNDPSNSNWYEQFVAIMNAAFSSPASFGKPISRKTIDGISTEQYRIATNTPDVPVYSFLKNIGGTQMSFELVSSTFDGQDYVYEEAPRPANQFGIIFKNDNKGSSSANTGFFIHFRQGTISVSNFSVNTPVPNELIGVNVSDINDTDIWLWQLSEDGTTHQTLWSKVSATTGNNIVYNSIDQNERNIYAVLTRENDQVDLSFADGSFGNLPSGSFNLYYRQSNGLTYSIKPEQMNNISVQIPYVSKTGATHSLTLILSLQYTVSNSSSSETNDDIKIKAPQAYYTQNRMVTAEDYNIAPLTAGSEILKVKSINRTSSGISKYFELSDVSGAYSKTNIFANDGILYKENNEYNFEFTFDTRNEVFSIVKTQVEPIIVNPQAKLFYLEHYDQLELPADTDWSQSNKTTNQSRGYFSNTNGPIKLGYFGGGNFTFVEPGALIKFIAPAGKYFSSAGKLTTSSKGSTNYKWAQVTAIIGDGANGGKGNLDNGTGPVILTGDIPSGCKPVKIIPKFQNIWSTEFETEVVNLITAKRNFGISIDRITRDWYIINNSNLDLYNPFDLSNQKDTSNTNKDASWMISFEWTGKKFKARYRYTEYVFESDKETAFFIDNSKKNYDFTDNSVIKDKIDVLSINESSSTSTSSLNVDYSWQVDSAVLEADGYIEPKKVLVSFYDNNDDGQIDDPDSFDIIVNPFSTSIDTGYRDKFIYFEKSSDGMTYFLTSEDIIAYPSELEIQSPEDGQLYYFYDSDLDIVKRYNESINDYILEPNYFARVGRKDLKFHYTHNSGNERRLDPSKTNIIDVYMLTKGYDLEYRNWLTTGAGSEPLPPTSQSLEENFSQSLEPIKSISDEIIYHPAQYKVLFGAQALPTLQATFKAVKNPTRPVSNTDLQTRILLAIEDFFSIENWTFGQKFNFTELATYVMNIMSPDILNFVIVPKMDVGFGSLYEINCESNEIFINGAKVSDIQILDSLTAAELKTTQVISSS